jgi:hypothetical protein
MSQLILLIKKYKAALILLLLTGGVAAALLNYPPVQKLDITPALSYVLNINPSLNLDEGLLRCLEGESPLLVSIKNPTSGEKFMENQKITFSSEFKFECFNVNADQLQISWYLDGEFLRGKANLTELITEIKPGKHTAEIRIKFEKYSASSRVEFSVEKKNTAPVARILRPKNGYYQTATDPSCYSRTSPYYCLTLVFSGRGDDSEDGVLSGKNLKWFDISNGKTTFLGTGKNPTLKIKTYSCLKSEPHTIKLEVTDSGGLKDSYTIQIQTYNSYC